MQRQLCSPLLYIKSSPDVLRSPACHQCACQHDRTDSAQLCKPHDFLQPALHNSILRRPPHCRYCATLKNSIHHIASCLLCAAPLACLSPWSVIVDSAEAMNIEKLHGTVLVPILPCLQQVSAPGTSQRADPSLTSPIVICPLMLLHTVVHHSIHCLFG